MFLTGNHSVTSDIRKLVITRRSPFHLHSPINLLRLLNRAGCRAGISVTMANGCVTYYLDFCRRYGCNRDGKNTFPAIIEKLRHKKQAEPLKNQAHHSVALFLEMQTGPETVFTREIEPVKSSSTNKGEPTTSTLVNRKIAVNQGVSHKLDTQARGGAPDVMTRDPAETDCLDWTDMLRGLEHAIKMRRYSTKTVKTDNGWTGKCRTCVKHKDPALVSLADVKAFLTWLASSNSLNRIVRPGSAGGLLHGQLPLAFSHMAFPVKYERIRAKYIVR